MRPEDAKAKLATISGSTQLRGIDILSSDSLSCLVLLCASTHFAIDLAGCGLVLETATENLSLKQKIFAELDSFANDDVIFATNTSAISISSICANVPASRKRNVVGMHFSNPPDRVPFLEVVEGKYTSKEGTPFIRVSRGHRGPSIRVIRARFLFLIFQ